MILRTEHQMATAKLHAETGTSTPPNNNNTDHLFQLPHVRRQLISLTGKAFERSLLWRLDWWNFLYGSLSLFGFLFPFLVFLTPYHPFLSSSSSSSFSHSVGIWGVDDGSTLEIRNKELMKLTARSLLSRRPATVMMP